MATEIKVWQISQKEGLLVPIDDTPLEASHLESDLESWIENDPSILGDDLLVIDRQFPIEGIGRVDLLCIDSLGALVIVELKRDLTPREAVAQALDYASWLNSASEPQIQMLVDRAEEHLGKSLDDAFTEHFQAEKMPEVVGQNHRIILAAPRLDAAAERIITYLTSRYGVQINAVFFTYARLNSGQEILARSVLVPEELRRDVGRQRKVTVADLLKKADDRKVRPLVDICRGLKTVWPEEAASTFGGSFRYWARTSGRSRMVYGINVSGEETGAASGDLDVWIPVKKLAEATQVDEGTIRSTLEKQNPLIDEHQLAGDGAKPAGWEAWSSGKKAAWTKDQNTGEKLWMRLKTPPQAEALVKQLQEWASMNKQSSATA